MKITDLKNALNSLNKQISTILKDSGFADDNEFVPDEIDTKLINLTPNEWQLVHDYEQILDKLYVISDHLSYLSKPIVYTGILRMNSNGRYACGDYELTCGSFIEYEKFDEYGDFCYWTTGRIESNGYNSSYYIFGDGGTQLDGLHVRFRW